MSLEERKALEVERKKRKREYTLHSDTSKIQTIQTYLALGGNLSLTSGATGISINTLENWKASSWWKSLVEDIRKQEKLEFSVKTKTIIDKSLALLNERIDNGDFMFNPRTGEMMRKPVGARDLHKIAVDMLERKHLLDEQTSEKHEIQSSNEEKLQDLAAKFAALAEKAISSKTPKVVGEVIDIDVKSK